MRRYRDRWIVGVAAVLSLLLHVGLGLLFFGGVMDFNAPTDTSETIDFDLADMAALEAALKDPNNPDRYLFQKPPANQKTPDKADAWGYEDHDAGPPSHLADRPINEIDRAPGPRGPGRGTRPGGASAPGRRTPSIPDIGQGVPNPRGAGSQTAVSSRTPGGSRTGPKSVDQLLARTGMDAPGGGEDGVNPYNPDVGAPGKSVSISTKKLRYMGYFSHMREKIYLAWVYPQAAQRSGQQGVTFMRFTVERSGKISDARVLQSSGFRLLDNYALKAVRESGFNPFPSHWPDDKLTVSASFHYRLIGARAIY